MPIDTYAQFRQNKTSITNPYQRSPAIWADCPFDQIRGGVVGGVAFYDDFSDYPLSPTLTTQIASGKYKVFGDTGNTISRVMTNTGGAANATQYMPGGALQLAIDTDNDESVIGGAYPELQISGSPGATQTNGGPTGKLWFECCYAQNGGVSSGTGSVQGDAIPTNCASVLFGLFNTSSLTFSTSVPLNDGDATANSVYGVGFRIGEDTLGIVDAGYTDGSNVFTNVSTTGGTTAGQGLITTVTAFNFVKLGFVYDPTDSTNTIRYFLNNVEFGSKVAASTITGTTNLKLAGLAPMFAATADSAGTVFKGLMRWWRYAQVMPGEVI